MKIKVLAILVAALSVGVLSGCGSKSNDDETGKTVDHSQLPAAEQPKNNAKVDSAL